MKKRTPWHPRPDGEVITARPGGRDWFGDRVFVEPQECHARAGYGMSIVVHIACVLVLTVVFLTATVPPRIAMAGSSLVMAAMVSLPTVDVLS